MSPAATYCLPACVIHLFLSRHTLQAFAGMVSILNDARIAKGKKPLGLLNPFLYQNPDAFTDVTIGSDKWGRGGGTLPYGFNCSVGWDPVTGLGTPKFAALLKAALEAP